MLRRSHLDEFSRRPLQPKQTRRRAEWARRTLILHNLRLVTSVVWRYRNERLPILDLYQEGNLGLIKAAKRFDYRQGNKFSTYAVWWIRQRAMRAIAQQCRTIRLPVYLHDALRKIHCAEDALEEELGREPRMNELAQSCDLPVHRVKRALNHEPKMCSLDSLLCCSEFPLGGSAESGFVQIEPCPARQLAERMYSIGGESNDDGFEYPPCILEGKMPSEIAADASVDYSMVSFSLYRSHGSTVDLAEPRLLSERVRSSLEVLSRRERFVIEGRFGLSDGRKHTLEELGEELDVTRERIRQIEDKALRKLRYPGRGQRLRDFLA
ncbi:MAG: sigma-70 family RNA polymerase sigma factor [Chloroflexota bacterium]|nr:sigma-70 family RNA polymerase sigma factor [Chloroflexota bacterium]